MSEQDFSLRKNYYLKVVFIVSQLRCLLNNKGMGFKRTELTDVEKETEEQEIVWRKQN